MSPAPGEAALRRRQRRSLAFVVGLAFGLPHGARAACGDGVLDEVAPAEEECDDGNLDPGDGCGAACRMECARVGDAATNHTCLHGSLGPFADRVASPLPGPALSDVDPSHTYYTVVLPGPVGEHRGVISFRPGSSRPYAIYLKEAYPMRVLDETGAPLPVVLEHEISGCAVADSLTWVRVYPKLDPEVTYTLDLGPSPTDVFSFALESLGFERRLYRDFDHDGFGEREDPIASSWCAPPVGYSLVASDCDDRDPTAYPGAAELCDGTNNDCDGRGDDTEPGLCAGDPLGGRCISVDGGASCGCRASADCAPAHECIGGRCVASGAADDASALAEAGFGGAPGSSDAGSGSDAAPAPADGGSRGGSGGQTTAPSPPSNDAPSGGAGPRDAANDGLGPRAEPHEPSCACYAGSAPRSAAPASLLAFLLGGGLLVARRRRRSPSVAR